jgi:hypothetical protein
VKGRLRWTSIGVLLAGLLIVPYTLSFGLPANVDLTGMLAMWVHGTGVQIEYPERLARVQRMAFHTQLVGNPYTSNWLHFPVSTPVVGTFAIFGDEGGFLKDLQEIFVPEASLAIPDSVSWNLYFRRYRLNKIFLCFRTASADTRVIAVHVHDGSTRLAAFENLNLYGEQDMREFLIPGCPAVHKGICISLAVEFGGSGQRWIELESVGADFYFWED